MGERFRIAVACRLQTPLHIAGPGRTAPFVDRSVEVDWQGRPFIPGSSLRGRVRVHLERLARAWGEPVCMPPRPESTCPHLQGVVDALRQKGRAEPFCVVCRIFGSPWHPSSVWFGDLRLQVPVLTFPVRPGVGIHRWLGTVQAERLFFTEEVPARVDAGDLTFEGTIEGVLEWTDIGWLWASLTDVTHVGGQKARGRGRVVLEVRRLEVWRPASDRWEMVPDGRVRLQEALDESAKI